MTTIINADNGVISGVSGLKYSADNSGILVIQTNGTTALTVNADQTVTFTGAVSFASSSFTNLSYTGTLTGGTGVVAIGTNQIYKDTAGKIGLGTTPTVRFHVESGGTAATTNWSWFPSNSLNPPAANTYGLMIGGNLSSGQSETNLVWGQGIGSTQHLAIGKWTGSAYTEQMRIDSSGNVCIGTNTASNRLTVAVAPSGAAGLASFIGSGNGSNFSINSSTNAAYFPTAVAGDTTIRTETNSLNIGSYSGILRFGSFASEYARFDTSGNLGIGITNPGTRLVVFDATNGAGTFLTSNTAGYSYIQLQNSGASGRAWQLATGGSATGSTAGALYAYDATAAQIRLLINSGGDVGIGTLTPNAKLEVYGQRIRINATPDPGIEFANTAAVKGYAFYDTANDWMTIRHSGNSGINLDAFGNASVPTGVIRGNGSWFCTFTSNINANANMAPGVIGSYASSATNAPDNSGILWNGMSGNNAANGYVSPNDGGQLWQNYNNGAFYTRKRWGGGYGAWTYIGG